MRYFHRAFVFSYKNCVLNNKQLKMLLLSGSGGSRRAPWEGKLWRAAPLPATPVCAEQLAEGRLLLSTTSNTYILEGELIK